MTNGQPQWGPAGPPPPPKPKPLYKNPLVVGVVLLVVLVAVIAISSGSAGNDDDSSSAAASTAATTATTTVQAPAYTSTNEPTTTATATQKCDPAPDQLTSIISASFNDSGLSLGPAFAVNAPGDLIYIAANTLRGGVKESSGVVWIAKGSVVGSLSSSARRASVLPDGRDLFDANAGDEYGSAAIECTIGSTN